MFLNERKKSAELLYYRSLQKRSVLSEKEEKKLLLCERGFSGECLYDELFDEAGHDNLFIFRDIWLRVGDGSVQIDSLIISDGEVVINEIKNYSGEYLYKNGEWSIQNHQISEDPISQVRRAGNKLIKMKFESNLNFEVSSKIIFPNPYFILHAPDLQDNNLIVKRDVLKKYLRSFRRRRKGRSSELLVEEVSGRIIENPYFKPKTDLSRLRLGFYCVNCGSFEIEKTRFHVKCSGCGCKEVAEEGLVRMIAEFHILFPEEKVTVKKMMKFTEGIFTEDNMQKIMKRYCEQLGQSHSTHYSVEKIHYEEILANNNYKARYKSNFIKVKPQN